MTKPSPRDVKAISAAAGLPVADDVAERISHSIGPAYDGFAGIAGTLPMDLEPATYLVVQSLKAAS